MLKVFSEKKKTVLFERVVVPVDIDNVPEMEKGEARVSCWRRKFSALRYRRLQEKNMFFVCRTQY